VLHVTGDIFLGQGCERTTKQDSSPALYLDGDLLAADSSRINNETEDSTSFVLYGTGEDQTFDMKVIVGWYGATYAPEADISIKSDAEVYGSFISSSFTVSEGRLVMYDAVLSDVSATDVGVYFAIDRWQEE